VWVCARPHHLVWGWALCVRVAFAFRGRLREQERERESHPKLLLLFPTYSSKTVYYIPCHTCRVIYHSRPCNPRREGEGRWSSNDTRERTQDKRETRLFFKEMSFSCSTSLVCLVQKMLGNRIYFFIAYVVATSNG
jgi:hypothetical protein